MPWKTASLTVHTRLYQGLLFVCLFLFYNLSDSSFNDLILIFFFFLSTAFDNMLIVPPGSGIVHQVNLEYLARVCFTNGDIVYPDSVVGTGTII